MNRMSFKQKQFLTSKHARINILSGAVRSGKTYISLYQFALFILSKPVNSEFIIVGRTLTNLKRNCLGILEEITGGAFTYSLSAKQACLYGRVIWLEGANDMRSEGKIRGMTLAGAYADELTLIQLPDLYVGYTSDFNRATSQTAQEITEKQVFQPERNSLAWIINNKLLAGYGFKYVEAYFKSPKIENPDDMMKVLNITERAGGLTPNMAKDLTFRITGGESENYTGDWADLPLVYTKNQQQIVKSNNANNDEIIAVLKETRNLLKSEANL